jgi:hypothetical protein
MDFLGELFSLPWIYRAWLYMFSSAYRSERRQTWAKSPTWFVIVDIGLSIIAALLELSFLVLLAAYFFRT